MTPSRYVAMELQTALEAVIPAVKTVALFFALGLLLVLLALLLAMAAVWLSGELRGERHGRREIRRAAATAGTSFTVPRQRVELPGVMVLEPGRRSRTQRGYSRGRSPGRVFEAGCDQHCADTSTEPEALMATAGIRLIPAVLLALLALGGAGCAVRPTADPRPVTDVWRVAVADTIRTLIAQS